MARALLVIDVQNDFTEGGALGVDGGAAVANAITRHIRAHGDRYGDIIASRDWHDAVGDNGGHFALDAEPDYVSTWPIHCVADTPGAEYHPDLDTASVTVHVRKGQGIPAYSLFEGATDRGEDVRAVLQQRGITAVDVAGIATDHCVLATARDALAEGLEVTVLEDLVAGVAPEPSREALRTLADAGATITTASAAFESSI